MRYDARDMSDGGSGFEHGSSGEGRRAEHMRGEDGERERPGRQPLVPTRHLALPSGPDRERVRMDGWVYRLRGSHTQTLAVLGTFRAVEQRDLAHYGTDALARELDVRSLKRQGLAVGERLYTLGGQRVDMLALTERGKALLDGAVRGDTGQRYYAGFVRWRDMRHEAAVYRMYQQEAARLEASGARILRVWLDAEIRSAYQRDLRARVRDAADAAHARERARQEFSLATELAIVNRRLLVPDLRLEYETAEGERGHVDLELTTEHYPRGQVEAKARAGFVMYRSAGGQRRGGVPHGDLDVERLVR
jgi:hypothetical protein